MELGRRERKQKHYVRKRIITENEEFLEGTSTAKMHSFDANHQSQHYVQNVHRGRKDAQTKPYSKQQKVDKHFKQSKTTQRTGMAGRERGSVLQPTFTLSLVEPSLVERRRFNIKTKLITSSDTCFTRLEEQEINQRAEVYALTTLAETEFYILPENVNNEESHSASGGNSHMSQGAESTKERAKRKRRSYSNIDCFVTQSRKEDGCGDRHFLPAGTKLLKPPRKLVELVAEAIDQSPDGLLQVQQIYAVLQNKFPYFRFIDKPAINSWRSSIRHALYQKWFRKIRFSTEAISTKGCFWAINRSLAPNEWIVPYNPDHYMISRTPKPKSTTPFLDMLQEPSVEDEHLKDVIQIAKEYGISFPECIAEAKGEFQSLQVLNVPSPVRDPDPILVACVPERSANTPKAVAFQTCFDTDEGFDELPLKLTPLKISPVTGNTSDGNTNSCCTSPNDSSLLAWTSLSFDDLPNLFSPSFSNHPYGMPVFPDH
ncbi:uncharacterized protein LOC124140551 [Haliotis rufescens]|uniref:uncharacterized protein LOC124140551 n=1 Tax=Haliotis rufescens TaxID=6454 RepID=UPI00201E959B|nr:uncharacterized protein LOC124140551 [Haliotis rufescens]XP_046364140.2 uncharacterized protein LOC124140551 [Haliotis rufescens]